MVYVKKMKVADPEYKIWLTAEEIVALLDHPELRPRDRAMLTVSFEFAPRAAELCRLRIKDYNPDTAILRMRVTKSRVRESRIEDLPVSMDMARALQAWFGEYARQLHLTLSALDPDWYLFPRMFRTSDRWDHAAGKLVGNRYSINPNKPCRGPEKVVQTGLRLLGYTEAQIMRNGVHCCRRSAGELAAQENPRLAQALLGHASLVTTEGYLNRGQRVVDRNNYLKAGGWRANAKTPATVTPIRSAGTAEVRHG
jgi:integrase